MRNLVITLLLVIGFIGSVQSQTKEITNELVNRVWNRTVEMPQTTYSLEFRNDSTFTFTNPANNVSIELKFRLESGVIFFPTVGGCTDEGMYNFFINGNDLTLQSENDLCKDRKDAIDGIWKAANKKENEKNN